MKIIVENLSHTITKDDLLNLFGVWGEVNSVTIEQDKIGGKPSGFVEMQDRKEALDALEKINGINLFGKPLKLSVLRAAADRRSDDPRRSSQDRRERADRRILINRRNKSEEVGIDNRQIRIQRRTGLDRRDFFDRRISSIRRSGGERR